MTIDRRGLKVKVKVTSQALVGPTLIEGSFFLVFVTKACA